MEQELISVAEAAKRLKRHKHSLFKLVDRLGIQRKLIKSETARGQAAAFISMVDFERLREHVAGEAAASDEGALSSTQAGHFYIIQLEPELDPGRLKLGFATSVEDRIRQHKTAAPFARVVGYWPCKLLWEKTAIDCIAADCEQLHTEVFRTDDLSTMLETAESFFRLMPVPSNDHRE